MPNSEQYLDELRKILINFESLLASENLRKKVCALVPACKTLQRLGVSLMPEMETEAARDRILHYFQKYPATIISGDELYVISGIQEWPRRLRELRVQFGWSILSGKTYNELMAEEIGAVGKKLRPSDYIMITAAQDKETAYRWNTANAIRRKKSSVSDKILEFLQQNVGKPISGEELRYVAGDKTEWARRVRELRTEHGWPVTTKNTGNPDLAIGQYVLEADRQSKPHDRKITDLVRVAVLKRDNYACTKCHWALKDWNKSDPRNLELHHVEHHADGGENTEDNLITACNICHDEIHRREK